MASLRLNHIYKVYPNGVKAVNDFNLDIEDNEFIVFVGPSGCGKSTTLRMIAGLEEITAGELYIDDRLCNALEPKDRDIAFVFQNYALYPHYTVYKNMAYGLKNRKVPKEEIDKKVLEAAKMLDLTDYLDRLPKEMSGGQRQRVALGRALVRNPKVFLLDEPLSNLDAKLRAAMRSEITKLHKKVKTTFIYVTHDQVEAMTMGTRIVVMKDGFIQQIDSPVALYDKPVNKFVAGFIGTPQMNFFNVKMLLNNEKIKVTFPDSSVVDFDYEKLSKINYDYLDNRTVIMGARPEHITISETGIPCKVLFTEQLGDQALLYGLINLENGETQQIIIKIAAKAQYFANDIIHVSFDQNNLHFFDSESEESILKSTPNSYKVNVDVKDGYINLFNQDIKLPSSININDGNYDLIIPFDSLCNGNDLSLNFDKVEDIKNIKLGRTRLNDMYIHFDVTDIKDYSKVSLLFEKLVFMKNDEVVVDAIPENINLNIKFPIIGSGKNKKYVFEIEGNQLDASFEKLQKIAFVDGRNCHKKTYSITSKTSDLVISDKGILAKVIKELDYVNNKYYELSVGDKTIYLKKTTDLNGEIHLVIDYSKASIIDTEKNIIVA